MRMIKMWFGSAVTCGVTLLPVFGEAPPALASPREQGSTLHGSALGDFRVDFAGATRGGAPIGVKLAKGNLVETAGGPPSALVGTTFTGLARGGTPVTFTITSWYQHVNPYSPAVACSAPADESEYDVEYRLGAAAPASFCDPALGTHAIAVPGYWNRAGDHFVSTTSFTFACVKKGVIAKCFDWCYKAYRGLEQHHFACTRMARADYCGDGKSNTIDDTFIDGWDTRGVATTDCMGGAPPPPWPSQSAPVQCTKGGSFSPMDFEAGWQMGWSGAGNEPRKAAAICLSKKRWQTLPLRGGCDDLLPDPRYHPPGDDRQRFYCDDLSEAQMTALGALHFNYSSFYDVGFWRFGNGVDNYSSAATSDGAVPPADAAAGYTQPVIYEGALWHPLRKPSQGIVVSTWVRGADHWTTSQPPPGAGWAKVRDEGWVVSPAALQPTTTARKLFCFVKGGDHLTTSRPAAALAAGYTHCARAVEGWLPY